MVIIQESHPSQRKREIILAGSCLKFFLPMSQTSLKRFLLFMGLPFFPNYAREKRIRKETKRAELGDLLDHFDSYLFKFHDVYLKFGLKKLKDFHEKIQVRVFEQIAGESLKEKLM